MSRRWKEGGKLRKPYGITDGTSSRGQNFDGNTGGNHRKKKKKGNLWRDWRDGGSARERGGVDGSQGQAGKEFE